MKGEFSLPVRIQEGSVIFPTPDEAFLASREKKWHLTLPPAYRSFLMEYNGAVPADGSFFCHGRNYCITRFLCVLPSVSDSPFGQYDISVVESQIGERLTANEDLVGIELLPIAELFGGDYVCLDYREGRTEPAVCVWSHEESGEFDPVTYEAAGRFEGFISLFSQEIRIEGNAVIVNGHRAEFPYPVETVVRFRESFAVLIMDDMIRDENVYALDYSGKVLWNIAEITDFKRKQGYTAIGKRDERTLMAQAFSGIRCLVDMERGVLVGKEITK